MAEYSIKDLENITSLKAHTIRIWEQRYGLLTPQRTATNIRFYTDDDLKKLLSVMMLMEAGMKISAIGKLSDVEWKQKVEEAIEQESTGPQKLAVKINQTRIAILEYDEISIHAVLDELIGELGIDDTYEKFIYPLLVKTGLWWMNDKMTPAQEHFFSNIIRKRLFSVIANLENRKTSKQKWILFLNEKEEHEIGLLYSYYLIIRQGAQALYLGSRVPFENLKEVAAVYGPTHLCTFCVSNQPETYLKKFIEQLAAHFPQQSICVSGPSNYLNNLLAEKNIIALHSVEQLKNQLQS
ncbi:DNA-binding transcriptional MerR regulator [Dyadobacter jejuensis]|uniref:DNA-binding transcriptional MerR regulator n=1 Tax=Dyadobacter jejuensis TaxID=1082580 RepID=A0A316AP20_9BACT|nr:MerR family transcriptional regulator [Dyadobacter jejuensis]PWJ59069.1 DNA-binding transcriptional MerR regulator [Dyadobacter jejuensis]